MPSQLIICLQEASDIVKANYPVACRLSYDSFTVYFQYKKTCYKNICSTRIGFAVPPQKMIIFFIPLFVGIFLPLKHIYSYMILACAALISVASDSKYSGGG
jgi:hypothetical protein